MRILATIKNSIAGLLYQISYIVLGFVSRRVFVHILGIEYYGLNSLITSILAVFSLADLGLGWAVSYNLYKPLADNDSRQVVGLMNFFRKIYYYLSAVVMTLGVLASFFVQYIVPTALDITNLRIIFLLFVFESSLEYICSYKAILLVADQKNYVSTLYETLTITLQMIVRIIVLFVTHDYILYLITGIGIRIAGNILRSMAVDRRYPYLKELKHELLSSEGKNKLFSDTKNIAVYKLCATTSGSISNILISFFSGIITVGLYSNYFVIINIVNGFAGQFINSYQASLGNVYAMEGRQRLYEFLKKSMFVSFAVTAFVACSLYILMDSLVTFWMGADFRIGDISIKIIIFNFCLSLMFDPLSKVVNVGGLFKRDKWNALTEVGLNIVCSLVLGAMLGVKGVFMGAAIGLLISAFVRSRYLFHTFFKEDYVGYLKKILLYAMIIFSEVVLTFIICSFIPKASIYLNFILRMFVCLIVPNCINVLLFRKTSEFLYLVQIVILGIKEIRNKLVL